MKLAPTLRRWLDTPTTLTTVAVFAASLWQACQVLTGEEPLRITDRDVGISFVASVLIGALALVGFRLSLMLFNGHAGEGDV